MHKYYGYLVKLTLAHVVGSGNVLLRIIFKINTWLLTIISCQCLVITHRPRFAMAGQVLSVSKIGHGDTRIYTNFDEYCIVFKWVIRERQNFADGCGYRSLTLAKFNAELMMVKFLVTAQSGLVLVVKQAII